MSFFSEVVKGAERKLDLSSEEIRWFSPGQLRKHLEKKGHRLLFVTEFPTIGRGNVLRDNLISHDTIDTEIDAILAR